MLVEQGVALAGSSGEFDEPLVIEADEGIILLDYEPGVAAAGEVLDEGLEARGTGLSVGRVGAAGVVDRGFDADGYERREDESPAAVSLADHVQAALAGQDQSSDRPPGTAGVGERDSDQEVPASLGFIHIDPRRHLPSRAVSRLVAGIVAGLATGVGDGRRSRPSSVAVTPASG